MRELFVQVLNASFSGSIVIGVIILLRLVLKKAPKKYICLLWLLAGLRLLIPFEIESSLSLQPRVEPVTESQWVELENYGHFLKENEFVDTGSETVPHLQETPIPMEDLELTTDVVAEASRWINWPVLIPYLWLAGVCAMGLYTAVSYLRLRRRVVDAVILSEGVWVSGKLDSAFVLGFFRPQIYLNSSLTEGERELVLLHERCHIRRGDQLWKLLGFAALAVHWFNPLVWAAYVLLCRDMEMACDEAVVKNMDAARRKAYSAALLSCSVRGRSIAACPVAFGEVSVKQRIQKVLNYRKPTFWLILIAVVAIIVVAACFLTTPEGESPVTLWKIQDVEDAAVYSIIGIYCPGRETEVQEVVDALEAVCCGPEQEVDTPVEEFWIRVEGAGNIDTVCFAEDFTLVWGRLGEENTPVYAVQNPEAMLAFQESVYDGVKWRQASAEPFAGVEEAVMWAQGISMNAVEKAEVDNSSHSGSSGTSEGGVIPLKRFSELLPILNGLSENAFVSQESLEEQTYLDIAFSRYEASTAVTIMDGANQLGAILLLAPDDTIELILTEDVEKVESIGAEYLNAQCWTIEDEALLAYMQGLREEPSYIKYSNWYEEEMEFGPGYTVGKEQLTQKCLDALTELQSRDSVHMTVDITVEGDPGETGGYNEYWQYGGRWMRIVEAYFYDSAENFTVGNLLVAEGRQYRFGHAGGYGDQERRWTEASSSQEWEPVWIMSYDLSAATNIRSVETVAEDGGTAVTIHFNGNPRKGTDSAVYECIQIYHLDENGCLTRLEESSTRLITDGDGEYLVDIFAECHILNTPDEEIDAAIKQALREAFPKAIE